MLGSSPLPSSHQMVRTFPRCPPFTCSDCRVGHISHFIIWPCVNMYMCVYMYIWELLGGLCDLLLGGPGVPFGGCRIQTLMNIYVYTYMYTHTYMYIYMYVYISISVHRYHWVHKGGHLGKMYISHINVCIIGTVRGDTQGIYISTHACLYTYVQQSHNPAVLQLYSLADLKPQSDV